MKKLLFLILLLPFLGYSQTVITLSTADTSKIWRNTGTTNAELVLKNGTRAISGFLYNFSNGTTRFRIPVLSTDVTGVLPIANGGTGSATKNFVDLTTVQTVAGAKTFTSSPVVATGGSSYLNITGGTSGSEAGLILNDGGTPKWQVIKGNSGNGHDLLFYNYNTGTTGFSLSSGANLATFSGNVIGGTYNGNTITTGTGVLTLGAGKTFTNSNTLTLTATDGSTLAIGTGGTLGTNAYTSTAYAPIASPTFTGTVTIPTPFTLGATSVTTTGTQLNYLNIATGTSGTGAIAYNNTPSFTTPAIGAATGSQVTVTQAASGTNAALYVLRNSGTGSGTRANINFQTGAATTSGQISVVRDASNNTTMSLTTAVTGTATNYLSVNSLGNLDFTGTTITASAAGTPVVMTAPAASGTLSALNGTNTWTGVNTFTASPIVSVAGTTTSLTLDAQSSSYQSTLYFKEATVNKWEISKLTTTPHLSIYSYGFGAGAEVLGLNYTTGAATFGGVVSATNAALTTPAFTGVPTGTVTSNTYVATITDGANVGSSALVSASYIRVGNQVQVEAVVTITATLGGSTLTTFDLSLPVASNFGATTDARGGGGGSNVATGVTSHNGLIQADVANDRATFSYVSTLASPATFTVSVHFQYTVI